MNQSSLKFGTSGLRGLSVELEGMPATRFAYGFAQVMRATGRLENGGVVLLGRDLRPSSPGIALACASGLMEAGFTPVDCGALPTPALALHAMARGCPAIMVTGSHIPADRNGLKFYRPDGEIDKHDEQAILDAEAMVPDLPGAGADSPAHDDALEPYAARAVNMLEPNALSGMRVGVYQHSSVARDFLVDVLGRLGAEAFPFGRSDTFVPVDTEVPSLEDTEMYRSVLAKHALHAIVSTDGDADRPLVIDENGEALRGDLVGAIAADLLDADCVVTPITSNSGIEGCGRFGIVSRTRIGSPYVIEGMKIAAAEGAKTVVGFEANGGVLLGSDATIEGRALAALPTRDAMLPILSVLWAAKRGSRPLSELAAGYAFNAALADRLPDIPTGKSGPFLASLDGDRQFRERFLQGLVTVNAIDATDGIRMTGNDGSVLHYRASGNAPELRCYVEAGSTERATELLAEGLARAARFLKQ